MYFSSVREDFYKAQVQNHYEKIRCDFYIKEVAKRHVHSLMNINSGIKATRDTLKAIQASSGYCKEIQGTETTSKSNLRKEREWRTGKSRPNGGKLGGSETQAKRKTSTFKSKDLDCGEEPTASETTVDGVSRSSLVYEKTERNILDQSEYSMHGAGRGNTGCEMNGDRSEIVPAGRLLRDEMLALPDSRNVSSGDTKGASRQRTDSTGNPDIKEPQGRNQGKSKSSANGGNLRNTDATSAKLTGKNLGSLTSRTDKPPESALGTCKFGISRPNAGNDGLVGYQTAPKKATRLKSQVKSAPASKGESKKNSGSRYLSASDVKIHVSLSRSERRKILQDLISSCTVRCDRSALERERQRLLQEKIHRFFELLLAQDDKGDKDDEGDISGDG